MILIKNFHGYACYTSLPFKLFIMLQNKIHVCIFAKLTDYRKFFILQIEKYFFNKDF